MKTLIIVLSLLITSITFSQENPLNDFVIPTTVQRIPNTDKYGFEMKTNRPILKFELIVYNRWGVEVLKTNQLLVVWPKDKEADGAYVYSLKGKWANGDPIEKTGYFSFVK
jgi:hypothetical protein